MRINELLNEDQIDEISLGKKITAKAARFAQGAGDVIGGTLGGIQGAWSRGKQAYQRGKEVVDPAGNPKTTTPTAPAPTPTTPTTAGADRPYVAPSGGGTNAAPVGGTNAAPTSGSGDIGSIMQAVDKLDADGKKQLAGELEKNIAATPAEPAAPTSGTNAAPEQPQGQALDLDQLKKDREAKQAADQAGQQQAQQQMATTQQANTAQSQQDAAIKAAADAAKAKPPFQQTAADKLAIKAAADKGIREEDDEEAVAEGFHSNFLGMMI